MIQRYPFLIFVLSLTGLWLSALLGAYLGRLRPVEESERQDLNLVVSSSLTMLGLIIGFTFSMAVSRYDLRKNYEEEEANAIGTEYVRADLLPADDGAKVRQLLTDYLNHRIAFYRTRSVSGLQQINAETAQLQSQ